MNSFQWTFWSWTQFGQCIIIDDTIVYFVALYGVWKKYIFFTWNAPGGGVVTKNLGRYVLPGLSKIGSPEPIFWLKTGVSGTNFAKICVSGTKNWQKLVLKCQIFSKNPSGGSEAGKRLEKVGLRSENLAWKKGVLRASRPHTTFQCECPPSPDEMVPITYYAQEIN